jgi:pSer/pThr/pTyr-binding forkhead associated (FHA) protein
MTWKIKALAGDSATQEINIERDLLVGRHQATDIVLTQADISRKHAAFLLKEQALWVQDLGSSNGTFVNDVRIAADAVELHAGDVVQFASVAQFTVAVAEQPVEAPVSEIRQPAEAVAVSELNVQPEVVEVAPVIQEVEEEVKTAAQQLSDQGMTQLNERDSNVQLSRDGMPQNISVPKPAPIPEGVDVSATIPEPKPIPVEQPITRAEEEKLEQKNASLGLMSLIALIILALVAWFIFK